MLEVIYHRSKFGRSRILPAAGAARNIEYFVRLFVCLFAMLLNVKDCAPDLAMKALEYRNDFDTVGYEKVCSCAPVFNFLRFMPIGDITKCRSPKNVKKRQKLGFFAATGRQNKPIETKFRR